MKHETLYEAGLSYAPCRYGTSRLFFRGPKKRLDGRHIAFVGGTETYGKYIDKPFATLIEESMVETCVNFGCVNAGIDAFAYDETVQAACRDARLTVVQVMGAQNMSNRFYSVHPRRNDRFLKPSTVLRAIYDDVDFADFSFTRHMLTALFQRSPERFAIMCAELRNAWVARMQNFLRIVGPNTILFWFADHQPYDGARPESLMPLKTNPVFVSREMIEALRPMVSDIVEVVPTVGAMESGTDGMVFPPQEAAAAKEMLGVRAHAEAAKALRGPITSALLRNMKRPA